MTQPSSSIAIPFAVATLGIALYSGMDAVMKGLALAIGAYNAVLWRTLAGAAMGGIAFRARRCLWPAPEVLRIHLVRGIVSAAMAMLFFWGLARVPMAQAIALAFVAPLIALYLAALLLGEKIERRSILASLLGIAGVAVILSGQAQAELGREALHGSIAILCSAVLYAYNIILMRQQAQVAGLVEIAFFMNAIMTLCFLLAAPFLAVWPEAGHWPALVGAAALAFLSMMLLSWAYKRAEAQHLAPVEYTGFVWAAILGWLVFAEPVRLPTFVGAALILAGCLLVARRRPQPAPAVEGGTGVPGGAA